MFKKANFCTLITDPVNFIPPYSFSVNISYFCLLLEHCSDKKEKDYPPWCSRSKVFCAHTLRRFVFIYIDMQETTKHILNDTNLLQTSE